MCVPCNLRAIAKEKASAYAYQIPLQEVTAPNSKCQFKVWFCTSAKKVNDVLATVPVKPNLPVIKVISMEAMERLADYYDSGEAVADYGVDIKELLRANLHFTPEEIKKTECDLVCTY